MVTLDNAYIRFYLSICLSEKKYFQDLLSQHFFFCQINYINLFSSDNLLF